MTARRILIMGLPGSGKTFLAKALKQYICHQDQKRDGSSMIAVLERVWNLVQWGRINTATKEIDSCNSQKISASTK